MIVVLFMGSIQLFTQGILGEYVRRIFIECKGRPTYILREDWTGGVDENESPVPERRKRRPDLARR
jgi:polyisoprenyl-phosphate glycosyltransferase